MPHGRSPPLPGLIMGRLGVVDALVEDLSILVLFYRCNPKYLDGLAVIRQGGLCTLADHRSPAPLACWPTKLLRLFAIILKRPTSTTTPFQHPHLDTGQDEAEHLLPRQWHSEGDRGRR